MKKTRYTEEQIAFALKQAKIGIHFGKPLKSKIISNTLIKMFPL